MALVDYSDSDSESEQPPPKKTKLTATAAPSLPPLPAAFHDLYASTVRTSTNDDPSLHQGRTRQVPHVAGNWPSHLYMTWHPCAATQALLTSLLTSLKDKLRPRVQLNTFLTNDLGVPLPLHISLSRPITLTTANKDNFLFQLSTSVSVSGIKPFDLTCRGVEWHRTEESGRSFLVLRVQSAPAIKGSKGVNPELTGLLRRCNVVVDDYGQPQLYQWAESGDDEDDENRDERLGRAFHVSIAWSFAEPSKEIKRLTEEVFNEPSTQAQIQQITIVADGIKAKIGNVVTHIPLPKR
ncbi:hypothetical protein OQA88_3977 [Cercophora sp. LCS_1]